MNDKIDIKFWRETNFKIHLNLSDKIDEKFTNE